MSDDNVIRPNFTKKRAVDTSDIEELILGRINTCVTVGMKQAARNIEVMTGVVMTEDYIERLCDAVVVEICASLIEEWEEN